MKSSSSRHLIAAVRAAAFDPKARNVVVRMPREMLEEAEGVISARELLVHHWGSEG